MKRGTMKGLWISGNKFLSKDGKEYTVYPMNYVKFEKSDFPVEVFINFEIYRDESSKKEKDSRDKYTRKYNHKFFRY